MVLQICSCSASAQLWGCLQHACQIGNIGSAALYGAKSAVISEIPLQAAAGIWCCETTITFESDNAAALWSKGTIVSGFLLRSGLMLKPKDHELLFSSARLDCLE